MDRTTGLIAALALALIAGAVACDRSDQADDPSAAGEQSLMQQPEMDPEMMARMVEIQEIQQQLAPIQQEALEDDALAGQLEALQRRIETAMRAEDGELFGRIDQLQDEMVAAEAAGDQERMQALMIQARGIQQQAQAVQAVVFDRPEIREPIETFEAAHRARMIEIRPEAAALLDRYDELVAGLPQ